MNVDSDAAQDRTCTARAVVRSGHRTTARAIFIFIFHIFLFTFDLEVQCRKIPHVLH
jgi:hypothetical protein